MRCDKYFDTEGGECLEYAAEGDGGGRYNGIEETLDRHVGMQGMLQYRLCVGS